MNYRNENPNVKYAVDFTLGFFMHMSVQKKIKEWVYKKRTLTTAYFTLGRMANN